MKQILKKYAAPVVVTLLVLTVLLWLGLSFGGRAASSHYYRKWIVDEADLLSSETEKQLAETLQQWDETYGSVMGLVVVKNEEDMPVSDRAFALQQSYGFGNCDLMLLLCPKTQKHYLADGDVIAQYYPNDLRIALQESVTEALYAPETADAAVMAVYETAEKWYRESVQQQLGSRSQRSRAAGGAEVLAILLLILVSVCFLLCLVRYLLWPLFLVKSTGKWVPLWGWHILGPLKRKQKGV